MLESIGIPTSPYSATLEWMFVSAPNNAYTLSLLASRRNESSNYALPFSANFLNVILKIVKYKFFPCAQLHTTACGRMARVRVFFICALDGGEWPTWRYGHIIYGKGGIDDHWQLLGALKPYWACCRRNISEPVLGVKSRNAVHSNPSIFLQVNYV